MVRLPVHLVRNPYGEATYDLLGRLGIRFSTMFLHFLDFETTEIPALRSGVPDVSFCVTPVSGVATPLTTDARPDDIAVLAVVDGDIVGVQYVTDGRPTYVSPVERRLSFDGVYLCGLHVERTYRNRGVAKRLVGIALRTARDDLGAEKAYSLVALDNRPSRAVLAANGFEIRRELSYYHLGPLKRRVYRDR